MTENAPQHTDRASHAAGVRDYRVPPRALLSRHLQTWLMLALAVVIVGIIAITGQPEPRPAGPLPAPATATPVDVNRVRTYQEQLASQEASRRRGRAAADATASEPSAGSAAPADRGADPREAIPPPAPLLGPSDTFLGRPAPPADPLVEEHRRREVASLFADNVAYSRRASALIADAPSEPGTSGEQLVAPSPSTVPPDSRIPPGTESAPDRLLEGTLIETVLTNRLDGTFAGPVVALVTTAVHSADRQRVLIPAGARILGSAKPVQAWGESRLAVSFHRLIQPDGRSYTLESFTGLNQVGETGLRDQVNRHYWQVFGASIAIGALSGLAQYDARSDGSFTDAYRQSAGASLAASAGRVLDRFLNILPTITIREGHRIIVYLTADLELPPYAPAPLATIP